MNMYVADLHQYHTVCSCDMEACWAPVGTSIPGFIEHALHRVHSNQRMRLDNNYTSNQVSNHTNYKVPTSATITDYTESGVKIGS